jgi:hypothetical protein
MEGCALTPGAVLSLQRRRRFVSPGPDPARGRAGGGRRVIRCEVSLDGEAWRRAEIERHETPTPANKTWCWVFWSVAVTAVELLRAPELRVRAVDSSQNMMPEKCAPRPARGARFSTIV